MLKTAENHLKGQDDIKFHNFEPYIITTFHIFDPFQLKYPVTGCDGKLFHNFDPWLFKNNMRGWDGSLFHIFDPCMSKHPVKGWNGSISHF